MRATHRSAAARLARRSVGSKRQQSRDYPEQPKAQAPRDARATARARRAASLDLSRLLGGHNAAPAEAIRPIPVAPTELAADRGQVPLRPDTSSRQRSSTDRPASPVLDDDDDGDDGDDGDLRSAGDLPWLLPAAALLGSAVVAVAMIIGAIALIKPRAQPAAPTSNAVAQSEAWMAANLPAGARLLTDSAVKWDLSRNAPLLVTSLDAQIARVDYIVSTPSLRIVSGLSDPAVQRALDGSVPIALFGSGPDQVAVRQMSSTDGNVRDSRRVLDAETRKVAERGLLANPRIHADTAAAAVLSAGGLDLRAATVLASLAAGTGFRLLSVPIDPAEAAANMPARIVRLTPDEPKEMAVLLSTLPQAYRLQSVRPNPDGSSTLMWTPMVDPTPPAT